MDDRYITAIDLGSSKFSLTVAKVLENDIQIVYYKETPSDGVRNSYVYNPKKVSNKLSEAVKDAENELNIKILQAVVGLPRYYVKQETARGKLPRADADSCISEEEVLNLKDMALEDYPLDDEKNEILFGAIAQSFATDDGMMNQIESDVVGMISSYLEGNFKVFVGRKSTVNNLDKVMNDVGVAVARRYFTPEVTAKAVLTDEEMEHGVALIDFGAGATSVSIYKGKIIRHYASIPFGGKSITSDIQTETGFSERLAENIKLAYGVCIPEKLQNLNDKILQINDVSDMPYQITVKYLSEIITARVTEIIEAVLYEIQESGLSHMLRSGIVLTGGGANLVNCSTLIKDLSGYTVRIGVPRKLFSASGYPLIMGPGASTSAGMILAAKNDLRINCLDKPPQAEEAPVTVSVEAPAVQGAQDTTLTAPVTDGADWDGHIIPPEDFGPEVRPERKPRPKRERIFWNKVGDRMDGMKKKVGDAIDSTFGNIFDGMKDDI